MAVTAPHQSLPQNAVTIPVPLGASNAITANPNSFPVYVTISGGNVSAIQVNGAGVAGTSGTFLLNASSAGTVKVTYSVAPTTFATTSGETAVNSYPFSDPLLQNYQVQQNLFVGGAVNPATTDA